MSNLALLLSIEGGGGGGAGFSTFFGFSLRRQKVVIIKFYTQIHKILINIINDWFVDLIFWCWCLGKR